MPRHPELSEFITELQALEKILTTQSENFWADNVSKSRQLAEKSDGYSVDQFLGLFGGMGSLNDLVLKTSQSENTEFEDHLSRAYALALSLKKMRE
jgi:hypothetical protein